MRENSSRFVSSMSWATIGKSVSYGGQLVVTTILARLIDPSVYGIMAIIAPIVAISALFGQLGYSIIIIRNRDLSQQQLSSIFWESAIIGFLVYGVLALLAPWISRQYEIEDQLWALLLAGATIPVGLLALVPRALLTRDLRTRRLTLIDLSGFFLATILAITLAMAGAQLPALLAIFIGQPFFGWLGLVLFVRWRPDFRYARKTIRKFTNFSVYYNLFFYFHFLTRNIDKFILGKVYPKASLGYYSRAMVFAFLPNMLVSTISGNSILPMLSKHADDRAALIYYFQRSSNALILIFLPFLLGLFSLNEEFVAVFLGPNWLQAAPILSWAALFGISQLFFSVATILLTMAQKSKTLLYLAIINLTTLSLTYYVSIQTGGIVEFARNAFLVHSLILLPIAVTVSLRIIQLSPRAYISKTLPILAAVGLMAAGVLTLKFFLPSQLTTLVRFSVLTISGGIFYVLLLEVFRPNEWASIKQWALQRLLRR